MKLFRRSHNWLSYRVHQKLNENHSGLLNKVSSKPLSRLARYISSQKRWWLVISTTIILFVVGSFGNIAMIPRIDFLEIDLELAKTIIYQRTANIAFTMSITLVVVGFLINNLAVKESFTFRILFTQSRLYPVIYFTLSAIGLLFLASILSDTFPTRIIHVAVIGTYVTIIILFLIGYLFTTIVRFSNPKILRGLIEKQFIRECTLQLKLEIESMYGNAIYKAEMNKMELIEYTPTNALAHIGFNVTDTNLSNSEDSASRLIKEWCFKDLNFKKVRKWNKLHNNGSTKLFFKTLRFQEKTIEKDDYLFNPNEKNCKTDKRILGSGLKLGKCASFNHSESALNYYEEKVESFTKDNNAESLKHYLDGYEQLLELKMKNLKAFKL